MAKKPMTPDDQAQLIDQLRTEAIKRIQAAAFRDPSPERPADDQDRPAQMSGALGPVDDHAIAPHRAR
jgi:hypothetical protein